MVLVSFAIEFIALILSVGSGVIFLSKNAKDLENSNFWRVFSLGCLVANFLLKLPNQFLSIIYTDEIVVRLQLFLKPPPSPENDPFYCKITKCNFLDSLDLYRTELKKKVHKPPSPLKMHKLHGEGVMRKGSFDKTKRPRRSSYVDQDDGYDVDECRICYSNKINALVVDCYHCELCYQCAQVSFKAKNQCPFCRKTAKQVMKIEEKDGRFYISESVTVERIPI